MVEQRCRRQIGFIGQLLPRPTFGDTMSTGFSFNLFFSPVCNVVKQTPVKVFHSA